MYPILIQLGPITIYSLWICIAIGFFTALIVLTKLIEKDRQKLAFIAEHSLVIFFGGLVGARVGFVIKNLSFFFGEFSMSRIVEIFYIWDKGLSFWGGFLGLTLTLVYFCHRKKENILDWLDILTISGLSGMVLGNIGTFLDGRNYGIETELPWGVIIENSRFAVAIHPVQLYAAIYTALLAFIFFYLYRQKITLKEGTIALMAMASYSVLNFLEEFLRGDESNIFLGLREAQIYCIVAFIVSMGLLYARFKDQFKKPESTTSNKTI